MPQITEEGRYQVTITDIQFFDDLNFDGDPDAFKITFFGTTPDGFTGRADLIFSNKQFTDNRGVTKTSAQKAQETLEACGVPDGSPQYLPKVLSGEVEFNCTFTAKRNGEYMNFYINPPSAGKKCHQVDMNNISQRFAKLLGKPAPTGPPPVQQPAPAQQQNTNQDAFTDASVDDIPF